MTLREKGPLVQGQHQSAMSLSTPLGHAAPMAVLLLGKREDLQGGEEVFQWRNWTKEDEAGGVTGLGRK